MVGRAVSPRGKEMDSDAFLVYRYSGLCYVNRMFFIEPRMILVIFDGI